MISPRHLTAVIALTVAVFLALVFVSGGQIQLAWLSRLGLTASIVGAILTIFNLRAWRGNFLQGWFVRRPHLSGRWAITLRSDWTDPNTGATVEPISASFEIRQTYTDLHVRMTSPQSNGELVCAELLAKDDGGFRLIGTYRNEPLLSERPTLQIHYGTFLLDIEGPANCPSQMRGHYWTDRGTKGIMIAERRDAGAEQC